MVELLNNFPNYVVAYKAAGHVNSREYKDVIMKRADEVAKDFNAMNFIVYLETGMGNYSPKALANYVGISFKHIHQWNRMAIVSDQRTVRYFYNLLSFLVPGKIIAFKLKDFDRARAWVSEPQLFDENRLRENLKIGLVAGALATSMMTVFSHLVSKGAEENLSEPKLLGRLIDGLLPFLNPTVSQALGWQGHYFVGSSWATVYSVVRNEKRPLLSASIFGLVSGMTGIFVWKKMFELNPNPPKVNRQKFYRQLFFAHLVFSGSLELASRLVTYKSLNRVQSPEQSRFSLK